MSKYRDHLPQMNGTFCITDGGLETTLIFHDGLDLPHFAAFDLLRTVEGRESLRRYFTTYARLASENGVGLVLDSATWRASADWGDKLGYSPEALAAVNADAVSLLAEVRDAHETESSPMVISGAIGPRGDGYNPESLLTAEQAQSYHAPQIRALKAGGADMISVLTMTHVEEAVGITRAAAEEGLPVAISFTVETDGCLPTGESLASAIERTDAETGNGPVYYMINCAHPDHFRDKLTENATWMERIKGIRANASRMSHADLDEAEELDDGDPEEFGAQYGEIVGVFGQINVVGGCCGTDHRHIAAICQHTATP